MSAKPEIFLVEDDDLFAMLLKRSLKKLGHIDQLTAFKNGLEILNYLKNADSESDKLPDIILLDINMPIMDGWQFLDDYTEFYDSLPKKPKIYMLSSSIFTADIEKSKEYRIVTDYLIKPIPVDKLKDIINIA